LDVGCLFGRTKLTFRRHSSHYQSQCVCILFISFNFKLLRIKLTNKNILCLVRFGSGRNISVELLIRSRNSGSRLY